MRVGLDFGGREFAHLVADRFERLVKARVADRCRALLCAHQFDEAGAVFACIAGCNERLDHRRAALCDLRGRKAEIGKANELALVHGNAAKDLRAIFADTNRDEQFFDLAEAAFFLEALGVAGHFPDRLDIGRKPSEAMDGMLFAVDQGSGNLAILRDIAADACDGLAQEDVECTRGFIGKARQVLHRDHGGKGCCVAHRGLRA